MKTNRLLIPIFLLGLISCGGEAPADETSEQEEVVPTGEDSVEDSTTVDAEFVPENADGLWQIDDYAEMMKGCKIYNDFEEAPEDQAGMVEVYQILDKKGGFASVTGAYEGWSEFVLWRMDTGNDLLGVMTAGCGPACDYNFEFYIMKDGETINENAEEDVMPLKEMNAHRDVLYQKVLSQHPDLEYAEDYSLLYKFPQKGTGMEVDLIVGADELQIRLLDLAWDKKKFSIVKKYEEVPVE